jgi:hypothetical protein
MSRSYPCVLVILATGLLPARPALAIVRIVQNTCGFEVSASQRTIVFKEVPNNLRIKGHGIDLSTSQEYPPNVSGTKTGGGNEGGEGFLALRVMPQGDAGNGQEGSIRMQFPLASAGDVKLKVLARPRIDEVEYLSTGGQEISEVTVGETFTVVLKGAELSGFSPGGGFALPVHNGSMTFTSGSATELRFTAKGTGGVFRAGIPILRHQASACAFAISGPLPMVTRFTDSSKVKFLLVKAPPAPPAGKRPII